MSNYIGVRCPVCNKKFVESDDIVVCPVCGAPHHRECYSENNQCAFAADHLTGKEWKDPADPVTPPKGEQAQGARSCTRCGAANPDDTIFCQICGYPLSLGGEEAQYQQPLYGFTGTPAVDAISMAYGGLSPDEEIDGEPVQDLAKFIGGNSSYFLPRFKLMAETGRTIMSNFAALFFNFFYYFYRKMYLIGGILLALYVLSYIPRFIYSMELMPSLLHELGLGPEVEVNRSRIDHFYSLSSVTSTINFFIGIIISICANRFYYQKAIAAVRRIKASMPEDYKQVEYEQRLAKAGGCNKTAVIVIAATLFFAHTAVTLAFYYLMLL